MEAVVSDGTMNRNGWSNVNSMDYEDDAAEENAHGGGPSYWPQMSDMRISPSRPMLSEAEQMQFFAAQHQNSMQLHGHPSTEHEARFGEGLSPPFKFDELERDPVAAAQQAATESGDEEDDRKMPAQEGSGTATMPSVKRHSLSQDPYDPSVRLFHGNEGEEHRKRGQFDSSNVDMQLPMLTHAGAYGTEPFVPVRSTARHPGDPAFPQQSHPVMKTPHVYHIGPGAGKAYSQEGQQHNRRYSSQSEPSSSGSSGASTKKKRATGRGKKKAPVRRKRRKAVKHQTRSGERTSQFRRSPTVEELEDAKTPRARKALGNWYDRLTDLVEFKSVHGHCSVPQKHPPNPPLGIWVNKQRMEKKFLDEGKKSSMTPQKLIALESVGFTWAKRKGQPSWDARYAELVEYKEARGDCDVPTKYPANPALGRWVSTQRSQYKAFRNNWHTQMTQERVDRLVAIGFCWDMMDRNSHGSGSE